MESMMEGRTWGGESRLDEWQPSQGLLSCWAASPSLGGTGKTESWLLLMTSRFSNHLHPGFGAKLCEHPAFRCYVINFGISSKSPALRRHQTQRNGGFEDMN